MTIKQRRPSRVIVVGLCLTSLLIATLLLAVNDTTKSLQHIRRQLQIDTGIAQSDAMQPQQEQYDPNYYAYLIIYYHRTQYDLARLLHDTLVSSTGETNNAPLSNKKHIAFQDRQHEEMTGCPHGLDLLPGIIHVQSSPNLFCDTSVLVEYLLRNSNIWQEKKGVKIIHLVYQNPFQLAVNNFLYHSQEPSPERWVKKSKLDICTPEMWYDKQSLGDLIEPTLLQGSEPIMQYTDFQTIDDTCTNLYRATDESKSWSYYSHLKKLPPEQAIELSTTHFMTQGKTDGDLLRLSNNIIKLRQVQQLEDQIRLSQHVLSNNMKDKMIQVMTMSMEEFQDQPRESISRYINFALEDLLPLEVKESIATNFEQSYTTRIKAAVSGANDVEKKSALEAYLRNHELFGRVLGNIERLVGGALRESSGII